MRNQIKFSVIIILINCALLFSQITFSQNDVGSFKRTIDSTAVTSINYAVEYFRLYSPSMEREIKVLVATPPSYKKEPNRKFPVLYTLHGANSPYDTWHHLLRLQDNLNGKEFIYTCFDGDATSNYIDAWYPIRTAGRNTGDTTKRKSYFKTFFFDEFMPALDEWYRIDPDKRAITGYSMGGNGALNYMLVDPEKFTAISCLSTTVTNFENQSGFGGKRWMARYLGDYNFYPERYEAIDEYARLKKYKSENVDIPPVYLHCGTEDRLIGMSRDLTKLLNDLGYEVYYKESEGGHNWDFWLKVAGDVIDFHWKYFNE